MVEQSAQDRRALGAGIGVFTIFGTLAAGVLGLAFAVIAFLGGRIEAAGLGLMAAATGYGLAANAVWRQ